MASGRLFYGWVVVGTAAVIIAIGLGAMFSLGVLLKPITDSTGWSRSDVSTVAFVNWLAMGLGSFVWGALSDRIGTRAVVIAGGFLLGLGLVVSSQVTALGQLTVTFGLLVGFSVGAFLAPLSSTATRWFTTRRSLAVALTNSGIGLGTLAVSPLAGWLATVWDWRMAMLLLGDLAWLVVIPLALLLRNAPAEMGAVALGGTAREREYSMAQVFATPQFWAVALAHFACCAAHSGPIFHMVTHATDHGVASVTAASVLGVSGLTSIAGRVACGLLADRFGAKRTLLVGLVLQAAMVLLYLFAGSQASFFALAVAFGVAYGGVMPLYAVVTRAYFGDKVMGSAYGAVFLVSTFGMGLGSFGGGVFYDRFGGYAWMYLASFALGLLAVAIALTFRAPRMHPHVGDALSTPA